ncbi:MAG: RNA polymerase sigma factor [Bacteroidetes bacterium]|nr:RNA polymerase sigma factor [Bacteroidota bacterium]MBT3424027.1 RNA polymerase sigma factor [Bacteroidota bacterium]MBT3802595.1 RNA polymerase sigma factor [Bacteroidota bacterium]MBT4339244.1 RNA polymerase sigma factor [Bacteroidota bacterium]MBT4728426.1 RNA polymerase sigma factor [Bacteroidota bacterium]
MKKTILTFHKKLSRQNKESVKWMFENYGRKLSHYAIHSWKIKEDEAWDQVYNTIYKVIESYSSYTFNSISEFNSFVYRVFINQLKNQLKSAKKEIQEVEFLENNLPTQSQDNEADIPEQMRILEEELSTLEDWQRILLLLRSQGMPYKQIANYVDKPEDQLKIYYQRLKNKLEEKMKNRIASNQSNE